MPEAFRRDLDLEWHLQVILQPNPLSLCRLSA
jgi:hypothetical protein